MCCACSIRRATCLGFGRHRTKRYPAKRLSGSSTPPLSGIIRQRRGHRPPPEPARFEKEAVRLQRADSDGGLDRIDAHLVEVRRVIDGEEAAARLAVEMKALIEQLRKQVHNIE